MRKLAVFNHLSLDGFFTDAKGDMSFARKDRQDAEWNAYVESNAKGGGVLMFGRVTYELMARFWPTPAAAQMMPEVAERMNSLPKFVVSRTLDQAAWQNTKVLKGDLESEIRNLKESAGEDITILGSGHLVSQLAELGLIDEYQFVVNPVALGKGRSMFESLDQNVAFRLTHSRAFGNGNVVLSYEPLR